MPWTFKLVRHFTSANMERGEGSTDGRFCQNQIFLDNQILLAMVLCQDIKHPEVNRPFYRLLPKKHDAADSNSGNLYFFQGCHCQGKVPEKRKIFKVREKSGNFLKSLRKSLILSKSLKSQGILFSGLWFISVLQDFEMHFLSERMKKYAAKQAKRSI